MTRAGRRVWTLRLTSALVSAGATLIALELILQVASHFIGRDAAPKPTHGTVWEFSSTLHHRLIPNAHWRHQTGEFDYAWDNNALGMRDSPRQLKKPAHTWRVLLLGDSFLQGHGVRLQDAIGTLLDSSLNRPSRSMHVEVMNAAIFGYSPVLEDLYLHRSIDSLQPDLVLVGFFLGNDVGEDEFYRQRERTDSQDGHQSFTDQEWPWSAMLSLIDSDAVLHAPVKPDTVIHRGLWGTARHLVGSLKLVRLIQEGIDRLHPEAPAPVRLDSAYIRRREREFALLQEHRGDVRYDLGFVNYPVLDQQTRMHYWNTSLTELGRMAELSREHGARLVLLVIPPIERLRAETDFGEPYEILDAFGATHDVPVINLLPQFLTEAPDSLYYHYDHHWRPRGHRLAAEITDRELRRLKLLPPEQP